MSISPSAFVYAADCSNGKFSSADVKTVLYDLQRVLKNMKVTKNHSEQYFVSFDVFDETCSRNLDFLFESTGLHYNIFYLIAYDAMLMIPNWFFHKYADKGYEDQWFDYVA